MPEHGPSPPPGGSARRLLREPVSGFTHLGFAVAAVIGATVLVTLAAVYRKWWHLGAFIVYGVSLTLLYIASSLYHLLPVSERARRVLRQLDHIAIFLLIAGTYTPICLVPLRGPWGWSLFGAVWALALAGMFLAIFAINAPRWLSVALYLGLGWLVVVAIWPLLHRVSPAGLAWFAIGGAFYTLGAVIYGVKRPDPVPGVFGFHEIFHLFVMAGSAAHFWAIARAVLPLP
ncbi:MAG TPA: hemolysin III family protein [Thermoanaerobaculaceae bacterium]|nr:hemolysin III family protein [Thermoanaerobaculaceae bacterium]